MEEEDAGSYSDATVTAFANFEGETNDAGLKHGWGKLTWDDGESFEGQFENDEKVQGTFKWATGDVYEGDWHKDVMHGKGTYHYVDGRKYTGGWEYGCRHGSGTRFIARYPSSLSQSSFQRYIPMAKWRQVRRRICERSVPWCRGAHLRRRQTVPRRMVG